MTVTLTRIVTYAALLTLAACATTGGDGADTVANTEWPVGWIDADGDCQDSETEVLIAEVDGLLQWADPEACTIASGVWRSWASDKQVPSGSVLVVPLVMPANAEASGARDWTLAQKTAFLNDLDNLIILDVASAYVRGNYGPDRWTPHVRYWCDYARRWQQVKARHGLALSEEEQGATDAMIERACPSTEPAE